MRRYVTTFAFVMVSVFALACGILDSEEEPEKIPNCSELDYWSTDGRGGCYRMVHTWNSFSKECVGSPIVIDCP